MEKRLSASENHLSAPAPSKAPRAEEDRKKNDLRQAASENHFSAPTPSKAPPLEEEEKMIFGKQTSAFPGVAFPSTNLQIHPASKNHLFKSWPLLTTSSGRTSTRQFFGSEIHIPNQSSSPIIDFFNPKASKSGHMLGINM